MESLQNGTVIPGLQDVLGAAQNKRRRILGGMSLKFDLGLFFKLFGQSGGPRASLPSTVKVNLLQILTEGPFFQGHLYV